jgi:hypothetical protein
MANDVTVHIDLTKPIGTVGFGVPLILLENAESAVAYTEVSNIDEMVAAGIESASIAYKAAQLLFSQTNAPKQIAVCAVTTPATTALADATLINKGWRQLIVVSDGDSASAPAQIITLVEAMDGKLYFAGLDVDDDTAITTSGLRRTILFYCTATEEVPVPVAALVGETAGRAAGSFTYKNLILSGVPAQELTDSEIDAIHKKGGITFVSKAGDNVTSEGKVAGGEYIDVIDSEDYIVQQLAYKTQKVLNSAAKVPYDNNGIALLESVAVDVLQGAYNNGMIITNEDGTPGYSVFYALREDTKATDRANRVYLGGNFSFALTGAIHTVEITGSITV